jgi:hypothetical protein
MLEVYRRFRSAECFHHQGDRPEDGDSKFYPKRWNLPTSLQGAVIRNNNVRQKMLTANLILRHQFGTLQEVQVALCEFPKTAHRTGMSKGHTHTHTHTTQRSTNCVHNMLGRNYY